MRTYVYVDGFNLYYGAVEGTRYKWLDIVEFCRRLLPRNDVVKVRYFTALVKDTRSDRTKSIRQQTFIRALETFPEVEIIYGSFLATVRRMPLAPARPEDADISRLESLRRGGPTNAVVLRTEEKGSDVNLATMLVADAFKGSFEAAAVPSTDSDLTLPIQLVRRDLGLPVGVLFPKGRYRRARSRRRVQTDVRRATAPAMPASGRVRGLRGKENQEAFCVVARLRGPL